MKFSIRLNNDLPVADYIKLAMAAEQADFDQFWVSNDLFLRSAPVILTAIAQATRRIEIGTCILNPYTINPAEIAMVAATLDELSGGRFNLGLAAGAGDFLNWIGIEQSRPYTAMVETVRVINHLFNGDRAEIDGHFVQWTDEAYLRFQPRRRIPIYIGAMSPRMLRLIGEIGDGGLPLLFPPEHYTPISCPTFGLVRTLLVVILTQSTSLHASGVRLQMIARRLKTCYAKKSLIMGTP